MGGVISAIRQCFGLRNQPELETCVIKFPIEITGEVKFRNGSAPDVLPANSFLTVTLKDISRMDAPSVQIGESVVDVTDIYKKGEPLMYSISCSKPGIINERYSVSAVLNVGWKPDGDDWIRKGDYHNDTTHPVQLEDSRDFYKGVDIEVVKYQ